MAKQLIRRYIWLIDTIRSCPNGITFEEINRKWERSVLNDDGEPMPKRTFHAHIDAILDEFDIEITCDRTDGYRYRIEEEVNEYGSIRSTLVDSLVLGNTVAEMPAMKNRVYISTSFSQKNIGIILKAIGQGRMMKVRRAYKFSEDVREAVRKETGGVIEDQDDTYEIEPYGVTYHQYWFLLGRNVQDGEPLVICLDRMVEIEVEDRSYDYPQDFDVRQYIENFDTDDFWKDRFDRGVFIQDDLSELALALRGEEFGAV